MALFTELETWRQARKIRMMIFQLVKEFPQEEKFRSADQLVRCSRSITNNIAEGHGRYHYKDNVKFCVIARGSLSETLDHMIIAKDEGIIADSTLDAFRKEFDQCLKLLNGYIHFIKKKGTDELE
ncbi:MAG: four helix bundle protein [Bacteroidetes bacterium]|nr:four helix bundle protein [Bacteroidota bacterium]